MTPSRLVLAALLAVPSISACGIDPQAEELATLEQEITDGNARNEATYGGVLVDGPAPCSGAFLAPDLVLTHARCIGATKVIVAGTTIAVELGRPASHNAELATLQLRKQAPAHVFTWLISRTRVTAGEKLTCFGYDQRRTFTSGVFDVVDLAGDVINLKGGVGLGNPFGVAASDDGGFCVRDGSFEFVATLSAPTLGQLVPRAIQAEPMKAKLPDLLNAIVQARSQLAVTLVDDPNALTPRALTLSGNLVSSATRVARSDRQGFYLAPTGVSDVVALVSAATGQCLQLSVWFVITPTRCNFASANQQWRLTYWPGFFPGAMSDGYRFQSLGSGLCLSTAGVQLPCGAPTTTHGMWLNPF